MKIVKSKLVKSAARLLGLVYAENPSNEMLFTDKTGNVIEFDPLNYADDCEKLMLIMRPTINHYSDGVAVIVDKNKPFVCKLNDFEEPKELNAYRFCVAFAAHNIAEQTYGNKFIGVPISSLAEDTKAE
jgi:hypothetical protein